MEKMKRFFGWILGFLTGYVLSQAYIDRTNYIPRVRQVQQGYAIPNKLEIKVEDLDLNGEKESILKYDGKSYLLQVDEQNRPYIAEYEIKSTEIVPRAKESRILEKEK